MCKYSNTTETRLFETIKLILKLVYFKGLTLMTD